MNDTSKLLVETQKSIKSLLLTEKNGLIATALEQEYEGIIGDKIPFSQLGFESCLSFLESIPDTVELRPLPDGINVLCIAIADKNVSHIR